MGSFDLEVEGDVGLEEAGHYSRGEGRKIKERRNPSAVSMAGQWAEENAFHGLFMGWAIGYRPSLGMVPISAGNTAFVGNGQGRRGGR